MKRKTYKIIYFLFLILILFLKTKAFSECFSWEDVRNKYNDFITSQNTWEAVIECYSEYTNISDAFVTTTDYETGAFATIDLDTLSVNEYKLKLHTDAVAKTINHKVYVVNRLGQDNITVFSPNDFSKPLIQFSTGNGTNPHDIVILNDDKAYITLYGKEYILVVNPTSGKELSRIDISSYADSDGIPEADQMVLIGNTLYITLQLLDRTQFQPSENGKLLIIDTKSDSVTGSITLSGKNPYDIAYSEFLNKLVISETGSFYNLSDGGIETVDLHTLQPSGFLLTENDLGGNISDFVIKDASSEGYIIVTDALYNTSIVSFDLEKAVKLKDILNPKKGFIHSGLAIAGDKLLIGDRNFKEPGVRIVSTITDEEITAEPLNTGLPPFSITVY